MITKTLFSVHRLPDTLTIKGPMNSTEKTNHPTMPYSHISSLQASFSLNHLYNSFSSQAPLGSSHVQDTVPLSFLKEDYLINYIGTSSFTCYRTCS